MSYAAKIEELAALRTALAQANSQAERFEREWYLRGDELERLRMDLENTRAEAVLAVSTAQAAERERNAGWFALVMNAAAALEDAANCLRDPDAKRAAEGAAKHYRAAANALWDKCGPNVPHNLTTRAADDL